MIPLDPGVIPNWQQKPVPAWSVNPFHAGPRRVGVGALPPQAAAGLGNGIPLRFAEAGLGGCGGRCGGQGAAPVEEGEDKYTTTTWGHVAAGAAAALVVGLLIGFAAGKKSPKARYSRNSRRIFRVNRSSPRSSKALPTSARARLPGSAFVYPEERTWPINDRYHAIKALQYAKWPQHRARRAEVIRAVDRKWGHDPVVQAKLHEYFPRAHARAA
jgi:hypothetical protein